MNARYRLYVGNIPWTASNSEIAEFFDGFKLTDVRIITDRETQRPRGFAFVQLATAADMESAIKKLDGTDMGGRRIIVSEAKERTPAPKIAPAGYANAK